jgi:hypothetical protein
MRVSWRAPAVLSGIVIPPSRMSSATHPVCVSQTYLKPIPTRKASLLLHDFSTLQKRFSSHQHQIFIALAPDFHRTSTSRFIALAPPVSSH